MIGNTLTLARVVRQQSRARGDHTLLVCDQERISYLDADHRSARLARALVDLGAGKGTHVGLLYPNGVPFVVAMLAAARIGAVVVPFSTFSTARELGEQLAASDVAILLAAESFRSHDYRSRLAEILHDTDTDTVTGSHTDTDTVTGSHADTDTVTVTGSHTDTDDRVFSRAAPQLRHVLFTQAADAATDGPVDDAMLASLEDDVDGSDPMAVVYTSGSSSAPKGVVHTHGALLAHQKNLNAIRGLSGTDTLFCNSPFFWIGGFAFGVLATLVAGATLVCSNAGDAGAVLDLIEAEKPNVTNGFVAGITHLTSHSSFPQRDLSSMRRGNLYPIMAPDVRPADPELRHNMLGMTEAGSVLLISADETDQPESRRGSFGKLAPGFETKIVDAETGHPVAVGETGELCIRGPYLMQRYYGRSREECFDADGWFHTGDLVRTDDEGFSYFIGRRGSMIKTAGANVSPAEVEKAIAKVTGGIVAHVVGIPDDERGLVVAAVVALDRDADFDETALRHELKVELSAYKIPERFAVVRHAEIPVLPSGKVDLPRLRRLFDA